MSGGWVRSYVFGGKNLKKKKKCRKEKPDRNGLRLSRSGRFRELWATRLFRFHRETAHTGSRKKARVWAGHANLSAVCWWAGVGGAVGEQKA